MSSTISIIIPVYNEAKYIISCLTSLQGQTLKPKEVIIIDDGSTDITLQALSQFRASNFEFRVLRAAHKGAGAARNLGAKAATGKILIFVDADMEFSPEFLNHLTAPIRQGKTKGTFSKDEYVKNWDNPWARAWSYCLGLKNNRLIPQNYPDTAPVFRAILKSAFDQAGGFDETRGYDDDWTLSEKLGYPATVAPNAVYYHYNPDSPMEIFHQAKWKAKRKYKHGIWGKLWTLGKTTSPLFWPKLNNWHSLIASSFYLSGIQVGIIQSLFSKRVSK